VDATGGGWCIAMSRWKPKPPEVEWQQCPRKRQNSPKCDDCGEQPRLMRSAITEQTSWMRGDDQVTFLCIPCALARGVVPSNAVCRVLWDAMLPLERATIAARLRPETVPVERGR